MKRAMMFIDYQNFEYNRHDLYKRNGDQKTNIPFIDLGKLPQAIVDEYIRDVELLKTFYFSAKPDDFLSRNEKLMKNYEFMDGLNNIQNISFIEGTLRAKPTKGFTYNTMELDNIDSYTMVEKGTDVNLASHLLVKAFHNSYDAAIVLSGDTDYLPVYDILNDMGKLVYLVTVQGQDTNSFSKRVDRRIWLPFDFFSSLTA